MSMYGSLNPGIEQERIAIYPGAAEFLTLHTIHHAYKYRMEVGKDDAAAQGLDSKGFFDVMGLQRGMEIDHLARGFV